MLKTNIKAGQITNLTDARYFAAWEVEWLGFNLEPNTESYIIPTEVAALKEWVEGPKIIGEFGMQSAEDIRAMVNTLELDAVQLGMFVGEDVLEKLDGISVIKEIVIEDVSTLTTDVIFHIEKFESYTDTFLIILDKNNISYDDLDVTNRAFLQSITQTHNILLSIVVEANQLDDLLETIQPLGLHVKGGAEEKVGFKSFDDLDDIFEALYRLD